MQYLSLYSLLFFLVIVAMVVVFSIMFFHMLKFRRSKQNNFHKSFLAETIWFLVPILILIVLLFPMAKQLYIL
jgi:heme/copper-type cytochrome/quinol oxidase subunit 2